MNEDNTEKTMMFRLKREEVLSAREVLVRVYEALKEKGHNPVDQLVGYLLSGDPAYITSHKSARALIRKVERDEMLAELIRAYLADYEEARGFEDSGGMR